jgi:hypothetical protein
MIKTQNQMPTRRMFPGLPGWIKWIVVVALFAIPGIAEAQPTYLACTTMCPAKYYWETAPLTRAAPSATPVQGTVGAGMALSQVAGAWISVCAASGQTLSGAGTLDAYYYDPYAALWMRDPDLDLTVTVTATSCGGSPCRCQVWPDFQIGAGKGGTVLFATKSITVSGGTTVVVRVNGSL